MKPALAKQFHQVVGYGLDLKERLERGERPPLDHELTQLRSLLWGGSELRSDPDFAGESGGGGDIRTTGGRGDSKFLGARYALTCWLDEIFIADSPYSEQWNERKLEVAIYGGSSDRAWKFWEQAQLAERRSGTDALEVYYWCVMLGFRGEHVESPEKLQAWVEGIRNRIRTSHRVELSLPQDQGFTTYVPRLTGQDRFNGMVQVGAAIALIAVPVLAVLIMRMMAGS
ncbi:MAG: DotU family type IV/VI secretion system protein [Gemmataceae bacterium]